MNATRRHFLRSSLYSGAALAASARPAFAELPPRIRLGTLVPKGSSYERQLQAMGEELRKASGGTIGLTIYPGGTMGGEAEMVRRIRQGQLHAGLLTTVGLRRSSPP